VCVRDYKRKNDSRASVNKSFPLCILDIINREKKFEGRIAFGPKTRGGVLKRKLQKTDQQLGRFPAKGMVRPKYDCERFKPTIGVKEPAR